MDSKKLLLAIPVVSALVLAAAIGVMAFSSSSAASEVPAFLAHEGESAEAPPPWHGFDGRGRSGRFGFRTGFDYDAFIAEELGVTVDELQDARQAAHEAALEQAVAEGVISEEQADLMLAGQALRQYIDPQEILSKVFGIEAEDIEAAREAGEPLHELFGEMEPEEIRDALQAAFEDAIDEAVADGVITDSQAELLQEKDLGMRGLFGKWDGFRGRGGFPFPKPAPEAGGDL